MKGTGRSAMRGATGWPPRRAKGRLGLREPPPSYDLQLPRNSAGGFVRVTGDGEGARGELFLLFSSFLREGD